MNDPRAGLPGASHLEQIFLCPASWRAQQGLPDTAGEDAEAGRRIHQWLAGASVELDEAELAIARACREQQRQLTRHLAAAGACATAASDQMEKNRLKYSHINSALLYLLSKQDICEFVEHRFWLLDAEGRAAMSGQADYAAVRGRRALVADYKTGRGGVTASPRNPQLMALAVMLAEAHPQVEEITAAIIQPALADAPRCAVYDRPALALAQASILRALDTARRPDAPRRAGARQCQYCRAKSQCPAARDMVETLALAPAAAPGAIVSNEQLAHWLDRCGAAEQAIAALREEARQRLSSGQTIPGWTLKPGPWRERVTDARSVFDRMAARGASAAEFTAICTVTKTALKTLLQQKTGARGRALDDALNEVIDGLTEAKPTAPMLTHGGSAD